MFPDTQDEVAAPLLQPHAAGMITEKFIVDHTVFCTPAGHIYTTPAKVCYDNPARDTGAFDRFTEQIVWMASRTSTSS